MLSLEIDPKLAWALAHRERFPVDLNRAPKEMLLRVPGLGVKSVGRVLQARRVRRLRAADLERMHLPLRQAAAVRRRRRPSARAAPRRRRSRRRLAPRAAARIAVRLSRGAVKELSSPPGPGAERRMESSEHAPYSPPRAGPGDAAAPRAVTLASAIDMDGFRAACRRLWAEQVEPARVSWHAADDAEVDLFESGPERRRAGCRAGEAPPVNVPAAFMPLCESVVLHRDPGRFGLLYRLLWRLQTRARPAPRRARSRLGRGAGRWPRRSAATCTR